jgi:hypothetical protein
VDVGARGHVLDSAGRDGARPAQRALEQRGAQAARALGPEQRVEARVRGRAERVEDHDVNRWSILRHPWPP